MNGGPPKKRLKVLLNEDCQENISPSRKRLRRTNEGLHGTDKEIYTVKSKKRKTKCDRQGEANNNQGAIIVDDSLTDFLHQRCCIVDWLNRGNEVNQMINEKIIRLLGIHGSPFSTQEMENNWINNLVDKDVFLDIHTKMVYLACVFGWEEILTEHMGYIDLNKPILDDGTPPLVLAALFGHENIVKLLIDSENIDVNYVIQSNRKIWCGCTPLAVASLFGHDAVVKVLMNADGIYINPLVEKSNHRFNDFTPLALAAYSGHEEVVKTLLSHFEIDADHLVDGGNAHFEGFTPLLLAAYKGHSAVIKKFIEFGNNIDFNQKINGNKTAYNGCSPLHLAAFNGHVEVVSTLIDIKAVNVNEILLNNKSYIGFSPLTLAANFGHDDVVKSLIGTPGVDVNQVVTRTNRKYNGFGPLALAIINGHICVAKSLIECQQVDVNQVTKGNLKGYNGLTPLHLAVYSKQQAIMNMLVDSGRVNIRQVIKGNNNSIINGFTPLALAVLLKHHDIVKDLIVHDKKGINQVITGSSKYNGFSPFEVAVLVSDANLLKILLGSGVVDMAHVIKGNQIWRDGTTYLDIAKMFNISSIMSIFEQVKLLKQKIAQIETKIDKYISSHSYDYKDWGMPKYFRTFKEGGLFAILFKNLDNLPSLNDTAKWQQLTENLSESNLTDIVIANHVLMYSNPLFLSAYGLYRSFPRGVAGLIMKDVFGECSERQNKLILSARHLKNR